MSKMPSSLEDSRRQSRSRNRGQLGVPQLPPLSINAMTLGQLQEFLPALMKVVMGDLYSNGRSSRPMWWPPDVPLYSGGTTVKKEGVVTESMKKVVRNCYHHLGQEALLSAGKLNDWKAVLGGEVHTRKQMLAAGDSSILQGPDISKFGSKPFVEIYICFFCSKEFSGKEEMRKHQLSCSDRPKEYQTPHDTPSPASKRKKGAKLKPLSPVPAPNSPTVEQFLHGFNLIPVSKALKLRASSRKSTEVNCTKLDFSEPETPKSPTTPKTPKLLISQLSRDESSNCKRRLSYRANQGEREQHSDTESVGSGTSEDTEEKPPTPRNKNLLCIDISSLLGQRVQRHLKSEAAISVVSDAETFCKTPVKNSFLEKLRKKENSFPITYKPRKVTKRNHTHVYCFTKRQRKEQFKKLKTGLNKRSRALARSMPECCVLVGKMSKNSIKYWERKPDKQKNVKCIFPEGPTFLSEDIDRMLGLRKKNKPIRPERSLSLAHMVSEDTNAEVLQQKVALYRSLLSDLSSSKEQSLITVSPSKAAQAQKQKLHSLTTEHKMLGQKFPQLNSLLKPAFVLLDGPPTPSSSSSDDSGNKEPFCQPLKIHIPSPIKKPEIARRLSSNSSNRDNISPDDSVSILTVSSSDEDSFVNTMCCAGCRNKQKCTGKCSPPVSEKTRQMLREHALSFQRGPNGQFLKKSSTESKPSANAKVKKQTDVSKGSKKKDKVVKKTKVVNKPSKGQQMKVKLVKEAVKRSLKEKDVKVKLMRLKDSKGKLTVSKGKTEFSGKSMKSVKQKVTNVKDSKKNPVKDSKGKLSKEDHKGKSVKEERKGKVTKKESVVKDTKGKVVKVESKSVKNVDKTKPVSKSVNVEIKRKSVEVESVREQIKKNSTSLKNDTKSQSMKDPKGKTSNEDLKKKTVKDKVSDHSSKHIGTKTVEPKTSNQVGLRRQASAPEGVNTRNLVKISPVKAKTLPKLGVRSQSSLPINPPVRGLKRQASYSPTKSAVPSPKKFKSDILPRRRSNSLML